jgi:hypothetical protein
LQYKIQRSLTLSFNAQLQLRSYAATLATALLKHASVKIKPAAKKIIKKVKKAIFLFTNVRKKTVFLLENKKM